MRIKSALAGLAVAALASPALAGDQTVTFSSLSSSGSALTFFGSFNAPTGTALDGGNDTITFAGLSAGTYKVDFSLSAGFATLTSAVLNGVSQSLTSASGNPLFPSYTFSYDNVNTPLTLVLNGSALNLSSYYAGTVTVTLVPEPETYALMLAGLGAVVFMARRRRALED